MTTIHQMIPWAPEDRPDMLVLLNPGEHPPRDKIAFLMTAARTLALLVSEANEGEIRNANNQLRDLLPHEFQVGLPYGLLKKKETPERLYLNPAVEETNFGEWKRDIPEALKLPPMPQDEANELKDQMSLESYISPLLT